MTTTTYDVANRAVSRVDPLGATQTQSYDLANNVVAFTDARGNANAFTYGYGDTTVFTELQSCAMACV